jgi:hypothetical protein
MIEILIAAVIFVVAACSGMFIILIAVNIGLFFRLRSRIPQEHRSDSDREDVTDTHPPRMTDEEKDTRV